VHTKLISQSIERADAKRHFDDFIDAIRIEDFAPPEGAPASAEPMAAGASASAPAG
jgi:hypothetical protein